MGPATEFDFNPWQAAGYNSELLHPDGLDFYPTDEKPQPQALVSPGLEDQGSINPELLSNAFDSEMFAEESAGAAFGNLIM
ncbi:hypothetical protein N7460_006734 [Penicillium canescens]|uniref:Uncharacterized protein n=1 Tax=Penicillium canescens TaxID=5083 RepID=A0AAD6IB62_PENCN|nr:hypothetical protein N7460_006734 [Penicillium canescens]